MIRYLEKLALNDARYYVLTGRENKLRPCCIRETSGK